MLKERTIFVTVQNAVRNIVIMVVNASLKINGVYREALKERWSEMRLIKWVIRLPILIFFAPIILVISFTEIIRWAFNFQEEGDFCDFKDYLKAWIP